MSQPNPIAHIHSLYEDERMACDHCGAEARVEWKNGKLWEHPPDQYVHIGDPGESIPVAPTRRLDDGTEVLRLSPILEIMGLFIQKHQGCMPSGISS